MIFETSWDDWSPQLLHLAMLLKKYNMPATFYLPVEGFNLNAAKELESMGFQIGCHTITHPQDMKLLDSVQKRQEIVDSKRWLEHQLGQKITSFCYPRGRYDPECVELIKEAGYDEARTAVVLATEVEDKFRKPTTIHFYNRKEYQGRDLLEIAKAYFDKALAMDSGYFHLWGHAWEIDRDNLWGKLEEFLKYINENRNTK